MARTQLTGEQVNDGSIQRADLDATTAGNAVIKKVIAGTRITLTSTGVDAGTGDVTINASASMASLTDALITSPANGDLLIYNTAAAKWENFSLPYFSATSSAAGSAIVANTPQKVVINTIRFDNRSWFSTTNNRFTPLVAGKYRFRASSVVSGTSTGTTFSILGNIYKNGAQVGLVSQVGFTIPSGGYAFSMSPEAIVDMNGSTDYVEFWVSCQASGGVPGAGSVFEGEYIGP